jgi:hypothetical protein
MAHPPVAGDKPAPDSGKRRNVQSVTGVVFRVVQIEERRFSEVVVGEVEVPDLGGDDRLHAGRQ